MPLYTMKEILSDAQKKSYGVGYFNAVNMEMTRAYIRAAEDVKSPIIIGTAEGLLKYADFESIAPVMLDFARRASVPVAVHLDHAYDYGVIMRALRNGFGSVMFDGSVLPYEENIKISSKIAEAAHHMGVALECELGKVGGLYEGEGVIGENIYTDPAQARDFVERTGADFLAVSIGTTHGVYSKPPVLDLNCLAAIREAVDTPLVLHGGSGLSNKDFKDCVRGGICKINIYTDVVTAGSISIRKDIDSGHASYTDLLQAAEKAMYEVTINKLRIFGGGGHA